MIALQAACAVIVAAWAGFIAWSGPVAWRGRRNGGTGE